MKGAYIRNRVVAVALISVSVFSAGSSLAQKERAVDAKVFVSTYKAPAGLVYGGQFKDLFELVPILSPLTSDTWGADNVLPRDINNGIEDPEWSYWGGKIIKGKDGRYHMFPCRWPEDSKRGHRIWQYSVVVHTVADNPLGPYTVVDTVGPGHNPFVYELKDGTYAIYCFTRGTTYHYRSRTGLNGPWQLQMYEYDLRSRGGYLNASNFSMAMREDGSYLAVDKKGTILVSQDGVSQWHTLTSSVNPKVKGAKFEDPALWRDDVQYHMLTHNWVEHQAHYLRSKDGIHWVEEPGQGYGHGIFKYEDGTENDWFRYERVMIFQDDLGRAIQANLAVLDVHKDDEKGNDNHSSKNVCIPLTVGRQIEVLNKDPIGSNTEEIRLKVLAEKGFNPQKDIDVASLRFGAAQEVNFGRGCKVVKTEEHGRDLVLVFEGIGNGFNADNFAGKLLGKTSNGTLLFGWSKLPGIQYDEPILSALPPVISVGENQTMIAVEISNFGQVDSDGTVQLEVYIGDELVASRQVPALAPFESKTLKLKSTYPCQLSEKYSMTTKLTVNGKVKETFKSKGIAGCAH